MKWGGGGGMGGFKNLNFKIFWAFQKNEYFLGYGDFVDIFGLLSQKLDNFRR